MIRLSNKNEIRSCGPIEQDIFVIADQLEILKTKANN